MPDHKLDDNTANALALLDDLIARARRAGADAADAVLFEGVSLSHAQRLGRTEKLERSESYDLGLRIFPAGITIIDDPHRRRGLRSKPFDAEGVPNQRRAVVEDGVLTTWLLD